MTACGRRDSGSARRQDCKTISPPPYPLLPKPPTTSSKDDFQPLHEAICTPVMLCSEAVRVVSKICGSGFSSFAFLSRARGFQGGSSELSKASESLHSGELWRAWRAASSARSPWSSSHTDSIRGRIHRAMRRGGASLFHATLLSEWSGAVNPTQSMERCVVPVGRASRLCFWIRLSSWRARRGSSSLWEKSIIDFLWI